MTALYLTQRFFARSSNTIVSRRKNHEYTNSNIGHTLIISALFLPAIALNDDEKSALEAVATNVLMQSDYITYGLVEIGYGNTMDMWFVSKSTDQDTVLKSLGTTVGVYVGACKSYPELSDLRLIIGTKDTSAGEMYCERSWADEVRKDSDGSYNSNDLGLVALRVLGTFKKTS